MKFSNTIQGFDARIVAPIAAPFTASEGEREGALIGKLVRRLLTETPRQDLWVFTTHDRGEMIGGAIFSRLIYADDPRSVVLLSPMAVASDRHGQGIGRALLNHALAALRDFGVAVAIPHFTARSALCRSMKMLPRHPCH